MQLTDVLIPTAVARDGMTVRQVFTECLERNVPGIPFCGPGEDVRGRVSIRHTLKLVGLPEFMVKGARLLGDRLDALGFTDERLYQVLDLPVAPLVLTNVVHLSPASPVVKALLVMEHFNSSYLFVMDGPRYLGVVTRMGIARLLLRTRGD
jgi:hypothetical protein